MDLEFYSTFRGLFFGYYMCIEAFVDDEISFRELLKLLNIPDYLYIKDFYDEKKDYINSRHYNLLKSLKDYWHDNYTLVNSCFDCCFYKSNMDEDNFIDECRIDCKVNNDCFKIPEKCPFKEIGKCENKLKEEKI